MRRVLQTVLLVVGLSVAGSAFAAGGGRQKPAEFHEVSDEERAAARERARNRVPTWSESDVPEEYRFPWMQIGFVALAFAVATPFAWSAYRSSAKELRAHNAFAQSQPRKRKPPTDGP